jgi:NDP-sugar pyrophosphorylase family protein
MDQPIMTGGIIAAGEGSRLRQAGYTVPKPLVPVAGTPLIERVIGNFLAAGIKSLVIIFNEEGGSECERWVRSRFPDVDIEIIIKTTTSSLESFFRVAERFQSICTRSRAPTGGCNSAGCHAVRG